MIEIEGTILNVKQKTGRNGDYQGVTLESTLDGAKFWFGNYGGPLSRQAKVKVTAESTAPGNNITFLNKVKKVELVSPAGTRTTPVPTPTDTGARTGWEDDNNDREPVRPAPSRPGPEVEPEHKVTEDAAPLGTLDDLAEGKDPSRYGGVILFREGTTKSEVEFLLRAMAGVLAVSDIREYDGKIGSPVYYIP